jgi:hypothetical protein
MKFRFTFIILVIAACSTKTEKIPTSDFTAKMGISEEEFYSFMNEIYAKKLDSIDSHRVIYAYAGNPIKIEFEDGAPTTLEPPGIDFLKATNQLDSNRLKGFKLIQPKIYEEARTAMYKDNCEPFNKNIGNHLFFIHLPWYNPKDSTLLLRDVDNVCPPYYHQGQGVLYRFKREKDKWILIN